MTSTGESKVISLFYAQESIWSLMRRVTAEFEEKHRFKPTHGLLHSRYAAVLTQTEVETCGGFEYKGVHWHIVHFGDTDPHNLTELCVADSNLKIFHGI
jgi:hypothetical protein